MLVSRVTNFSGQHGTLRDIELIEHGVHTASGVIDVHRLSREGGASLLQVLGGPDGVDGLVEWCMQVHDSDVRGVLLWEWSNLLQWKKTFERRARSAR
jgi:hypothetical protein